MSLYFQVILDNKQLTEAEQRVSMCKLSFSTWTIFHAADFLFFQCCLKTIPQSISPEPSTSYGETSDLDAGGATSTDFLEGTTYVTNDDSDALVTHIKKPKVKGKRSRPLKQKVRKAEISDLGSEVESTSVASSYRSEWWLLKCSLWLW